MALTKWQGFEFRVPVLGVDHWRCHLKVRFVVKTDYLDWPYCALRVACAPVACRLRARCVPVACRSRERVENKVGLHLASEELVD